MSTGFIIQADKTKAKKDCRRWILRRSTGYDARTGKYKTASRRFSGTYREAQEALAQWNGEAKRHNHVGLFEDHAAAWLESRNVASGTLQKNKHHLQAVCSIVGNFALDAINTADMEDCFSQLARKYSGTYVNDIYQTTRQLFKDAVKRGIIERSPMEGMEAPKISTQEKEALTQAQVSRIVAGLRPLNAQNIAVALALLAGLRRGEIGNALTWGMVDFQNRMLRVPGTKSAASKAPVPMGETLASMLEEWKQLQDVSAYVVPLTPAAITRHWQRTGAASFSLQGTTFHQLRHTFITSLARAGVHPSTMQRLARHSDPRTTLHVYTHVQMEQERAAIEALERGLI